MSALLIPIILITAVLLIGMALAYISRRDSASGSEAEAYLHRLQNQYVPPTPLQRYVQEQSSMPAHQSESLAPVWNAPSGDTPHQYKAADGQLSTLERVQEFMSREGFAEQMGRTQQGGAPGQNRPPGNPDSGT